LVTLKAAVVLIPNLTLPNVRLVFVMVKPAMPAPLSVTCCGLVVALSKIIRVALCAPSAAGVNFTPIVQMVLGATVMGIAPQVPVPLSEYSGSDDVALETISGWVAPEFSTVRFFVSAWPRETLPNAREVVTVIVVVGVPVGVAVAVGVAMRVAVAVVVLVLLAVGVAVLVAVAVEDLDGVAVAVAVKVAVLVAVGVDVLVAVGVGDDEPPVPNAITLAE
jgi:hypothetical protein